MPCGFMGRRCPTPKSPPWERGEPRRPSSTWTRTSSDGGLTWSEPKMLAERMQAPGVLRLKSGDVLLNGCRVGDKAASTMLLFRSKDSGKTWMPQRPIWENSTKEFILQG